MNLIQLLLPAIEHFHIMGYWFAFLAAALETVIGIGLIIPGSTIVLFMGALAARGYFDLGDLIWFAVIGAIIGDNINYFVGRKYGARILKDGFWFFKPAHFKKGEKFFYKYGIRSVLIGRFLPSTKEIVPFIAGVFGMKRLTFMFYNILGAVGWSMIWVLAGYFFAQSLDIAKVWLTRTGLFLTVFLGISIALYFLKIFLLKKGKAFFLFLSSLWRSLKQGVAANPEVQEFVSRHRKFFIFLQKRLDKKDFFGLPLTFLVIALIYLLILLAGIIEDVVNSEIIVSADIRVANLLAIFRSTGLVKVFLWITLLGKWQVIFIFVITVVLLLWLWQRRSYIVPLLVAVAGSSIFTFMGKIIFHRPRPSAAVYYEHSFSFPSGHAAISMAFYGFVTYCLIKISHKWKTKINLFLSGLIVILLIGFSRLYLGVHYLSDVWGGYLVGGIWLVIAISLSELLVFRVRGNKRGETSAGKRMITLAIVAVSICLYIIFAFYYQLHFASQSAQADKKKITANVLSIFDSDQLKYTETLLGNRQEPLSFVIVAKDDQQLIDLFNKAGWYLADDINIFTISKMFKAALLKESYPQAPMTPDFWHTEVHDFGFEKETKDNNIQVRHHVRFWRTDYLTSEGKTIYVGTASFDEGIKWVVTHRINPNIDIEREFLFNDLQTTGRLLSIKKVQFVKPELGKNFSGDLFFTDGKLYLIFIKD